MAGGGVARVQAMRREGVTACGGGGRCARLGELWGCDAEALLRCGSREVGAVVGLAPTTKWQVLFGEVRAQFVAKEKRKAPVLN